MPARGGASLATGQKHADYIDVLSLRNCMWVERGKENKAGRSEGHSQHGQPASITSGQRRAHNQHHIAGSKPITHHLQNQEGSRFMCGIGSKKTKQTGQSGTCQHSQPASITHVGNEGTQPALLAGSLAITHHLQNQDGSICMCGVGGQKKTKQTGQEWHMPAWLANNTHVGSKGTQQAPHGWKQGRDHSRAAESGWIHMHVWYWE